MYLGNRVENRYEGNSIQCSEPTKSYTHNKGVVVLDAGTFLFYVFISLSSESKRDSSFCCLKPFRWTLYSICLDRLIGLSGNFCALRRILHFQGHWHWRFFVCLFDKTKSTLTPDINDGIHNTIWEECVISNFEFNLNVLDFKCHLNWSQSKGLGGIVLMTFMTMIWERILSDFVL